MKNPLEDLLNKYPLPKKWDRLETFVETQNIEDIAINMVGLSLDHHPVLPIIGSAANLQEPPWERAYFELLERGYLLNIESQCKDEPFTRFHLLDQNKKLISYISGARIFKEAPIEDLWRYARSNGVALHTNFESAATNAVNELLERDRFLRFWYSRRAPRYLKNWVQHLPANLFHLYDLRAYLFDEPGDFEQGIFVVVIFGFPKKLGPPFLIGLGCANTVESAFQKSLSETYQRLGFMWDEKPPTRFPDFSLTPDFHLHYYEHPDSWSFLKKWLEQEFAPRELNFAPVKKSDIFLVNLELESIPKNLFLIKAVANNAIPLTFGIGNPNLPFLLVGQEGIHPIA